MMLTLLAYAYCCGVLSTRAIEARCRVDATFRLACAGLVPGHSAISRFRQRACGEDGPVEEVFYAVLRVCAAAGLGRLSVVAADGVKIGANASKEANRTGAGLRKLAAAIMAGAAAADEPGAAETGEDLFGGEALGPGWADPRSRLGRVRACLADFAAQREAAQAARRAQGQAWLDARAAGQPVTKPPAAVAVEAARIALEQEVARHQALVDEWDRKRAAGEMESLHFSGQIPIMPHLHQECQWIPRNAEDSVSPGGAVSGRDCNTARCSRIPRTVPLRHPATDAGG